MQLLKDLAPSWRYDVPHRIAENELSTKFLGSALAILRRISDTAGERLVSGRIAHYATFAEAGGPSTPSGRRVRRGIVSPMKWEERVRKAQELNDRRRFLIRQPKALELRRLHERAHRNYLMSRQRPPVA